MKVSLNWIKKLVNIEDITPEELADKLTFAGVEVDSISNVASATGLVIGQVIECENHPDSDHLHILKVNEGSKYGIHTIVCGAPNVRKGLKVIVARSGAVLPEVTIVPTTIRGVESDGMCCSLAELGVDKKYLTDAQLDGIEELEEDAPVGEEDVIGYLGLDDVVLDLDLLANRSDLYAIENVAKEVATLFDRELNLEEEPTNIFNKNNDVVLEINTPKCSAFRLATVKDVKTKESPAWMVKFLRSCGIRSINNIVDIGNYVMLLTGQPLNMYDYDTLNGKKLDVRDDFDGDFVAMDENTYKLEQGDIVIMDENEPVCLAGIMTSKKAEVTPESKNIVIEAAYFNGASIRRTSNRVGLASDSSARFIKGINERSAKRALALATKLLIDLADAKEVGSEVVIDNLPHEEKTIKTSLEYINNRLGTNFDLETVLNILKADHFEVLEQEGNTFTLSVPYYRIDVKEAADISEEVIRLLGFDNIVSKLPEGGDLYQGLTEAQKNKNAIRRYLRNNGIDEVLTYSLVNKDQAAAFDYIFKGDAYKLLNPMTEDRAYLRRSVAGSLCEVASFNKARRNDNLAIYEISNIDTLKEQGTTLGLVLLGNNEERGMLTSRKYDFYDVKGYFEGIMDLLSVNPSRYRYARLKSDKEEFHPGRSVEVLMGKKTIAVMGELHPHALKKYGLGKNAVVMEINLGELINLRTSKVKAVVPSKYPTVSRDLSFIVNKDALAGDIIREIRRSDKTIKDINVFDVYEGEGIDNDKKSMAISIILGNDSRTLKEEEINLTIKKAMNTLKTKFLAEVREN